MQRNTLPGKNKKQKEKEKTLLTNNTNQAQHRTKCIDELQNTHIERIGKVTMQSALQEGNQTNHFWKLPNWYCWLLRLEKKSLPVDVDADVTDVPSAHVIWRHQATLFFLFKSVAQPTYNANMNCHICMNMTLI